MKKCQLRILGLALCMASAMAFAQSYPSKPVRLIVPFPPGGGTDLIGRTVGQKLSDKWGQQVVIDNRGGGGGVIGTELVARSAPDGYTLLLGSSSGLVMNPLLVSKLPYDAIRDFAPVGLLAVNPTMLVVTVSLPVQSVKDLIAIAKAKPGALNYASGGQGSPIHLAMELFKMMTSTNIVHVPYKGPGPAMPDLISGQVQLMFSTIPSVLPLVKAGKLKGLGVGSTRRSLVAPDIPTVAEAGVPGFEAVSWYGIFVPQKTPKAIIAKLSADAVQVLADKSTAQLLVSQGSEPKSSTSAELASYMREESKRWEKVIRTGNIKAE